MSCDEIKINDKANEITIINTEDIFSVTDNDNTTTIIDSVDKFEITELEAEVITINLTDVRLIPPQQVDVARNCTATEQIGDAVYVFADGEVRQANNASLATAKVMGFIATKPTTTSCLVRIVGLITSIAGLNPGSQYFLGASGGISLTAPTITGSVAVKLGESIGTSEFLINISNNRLIRS